MKNYLTNCFLLIIPILVWNILLVDHLPESYAPAIFSKDIPQFVEYSENILRVFALGMPLVMLFSIKTRTQRIGLIVYILGTLLYFMSWIVLIVAPESAWSASHEGFMAPAFTPLIWLIGIGLMVEGSYFNFPKAKIIYLIVSVLFVVMHATHAAIVYTNHYF